jgi:hypothetical protein
VINPRTDETFTAFVREQAMDLPGIDPVALENRLRERHPSATVRPRSLSSEPDIVWYVYRDGRWTPSG